MSAQVVFVRVHEADAVRGIIEEAIEATGEYDVGSPEWVAVFNKAVDLLAARIPLQPMPAPMNFPFDLNHLKGTA